MEVVPLGQLVAQLGDALLVGAAVSTAEAGAAELVEPEDAAEIAQVMRRRRRATRQYFDEVLARGEDITRTVVGGVDDGRHAALEAHRDALQETVVERAAGLGLEGPHRRLDLCGWQAHAELDLRLPEHADSRELKAGPLEGLPRLRGP